MFNKALSSRMDLSTVSKASLQKRIDAYFEYCKKKQKPKTMTGLALHLGITRKTLTEFSRTDRLGDVIEKAKLRCENELEERLISGMPATGIIFALKNNYGWHDKLDIDQTLRGTISLSALFDTAAARLQNRNEEAIEGSTVSELPANSEVVAAEEDDDDIPENLFTN